MFRSFAVFVVLALLACGAIHRELEAGHAFGSAHDLEACLSESLARLDACESMGCEALAPAFARGCAKDAAFSERLCGEVPNSALEAASWIRSQCKSHGNAKACYKVYQQPVARCIDAAA